MRRKLYSCSLVIFKNLAYWIFWFISSEKKHATRMYLKVDRRKQATETVFRYSKAGRQLRAMIIQLKVQPKMHPSCFQRW